MAGQESVELDALATRIVEAVLSDFRGRKGFGGFWDDIDEDIKTEIVEELEATVLEVLNDE